MFSSLNTGIKPSLLYRFSIYIGITVGLVTAAFRVALDQIYIWHEWTVASLGSGLGIPEWLIAMLLGMVMFTLAAWLVYQFAPEAVGSGIPEIVGVLHKVRLPPRNWQLITVKFFGTVLAIGAGGTLGRGGPSVHIGGALGQWLGERARLTRSNVELMVAIGAGAGLSAIFNAPLAGILFVFEELRDALGYSLDLAYGLLLACGCASLMVTALVGSTLVLPLPVYPVPPLADLVLFVALGGVLGIFGAVFNTALLGMLDLMAGWRQQLGFFWVLPLIVGGCIGALTVLWPDVVGGGGSMLISMADGWWPLAPLMAVLAIRLVTFLFSYCSGVPGGMFVPQLVLGALIGLAFSEVSRLSGLSMTTTPGAFAIAGMAGLLAATARTPLTSMLLAAEITRNYNLLPAMLVTCIAAMLMARALGGKPLYFILLERTLETIEPRPHHPAIERYSRMDPDERRQWLLNRARH